MVGQQIQSLMATSRGTWDFALKVWWGLSIPYVIVYVASVWLFGLTPGYQIHVIEPIYTVFWNMLHLAIAWTVMGLVLFIARRFHQTVVENVMLVLGVVVSVCGVFIIRG
jgi:hypothetical protein